MFRVRKSDVLEIQGTHINGSGVKECVMIVSDVRCCKACKEWCGIVPIAQVHVEKEWRFMLGKSMSMEVK